MIVIMVVITTVCLGVIVNNLCKRKQQRFTAKVRNIRLLVREAAENVILKLTATWARVRRDRRANQCGCSGDEMIHLLRKELYQEVVVDLANAIIDELDKDEEKVLNAWRRSVTRQSPASVPDERWFTALSRASSASNLIVILILSFDYGFTSFSFSRMSLSFSFFRFDFKNFPP